MDISPLDTLVVALGIYAISSIISLCISRRFEASIRLGNALSAIASIFLIITALIPIIMDNSYNYILWGLGLHFDALTSLMLLVIGIPSLASSIFSMSYLEYYREKKCPGIFITLFNIFVSSMSIIVSSYDFLTFLFAWEIMTLTSYILIVWDHDKRFVREAGLQYMVSMHVLSSIPLILAVAILYGYTHVLLFSRLAEMVSFIPAPAYFSVVALLYLAFITKAGLYPLHYWLPDAHPAAPSNISALLSGVMIKMGIYGLIGILFRYLHAPPILCYILVVQGLLSIFWGSVKAINENNAKRLLAFSSVSQIGYIVVPLGLAIIASGYGSGAASLLMGAGLFYLFAHSLFKTLLFLTSGCYLYVVGTSDLNKLSQYNFRDTIFKASVFIGSLSLAGLPPFLGYLAKLSSYSAVLSGHNFWYGVVAIGLMALSPFTMLYSAKYIVPAISRIGVTEMPKKLSPSIKIGLLIPSAILVTLGCFSVFRWFASIGIICKMPGMDAQSILSGFIHIVPPYSYYVPIFIAVVFLAGLIMALIDGARNAIKTSVWTTGYRIKLSKHRISPGYLFNELALVFKPSINYSHEVYECIIWRIPRKLSSSGIANNIVGFFGRLASWISGKVLSFSEEYTHIKEFKLDEYVGSTFVSMIRIAGSFIRMLIVSPLALFTVAIFILMIIVLIIIVAIG